MIILTVGNLRSTLLVSAAPSNTLPKQITAGVPASAGCAGPLFYIRILQKMIEITIQRIAADPL
jgi:hypothetical protein